MPLSITGRSSRTWIWATLIVALLALRLPAFARPPGADQGLYTYAAQQVTEGRVPYRDAWEQKPPGVFIVYAAFGLAVPVRAIPAAADLGAAALTAWLLVVVGRRVYGGYAGELAAIAFLLLGDPGIQRLGGMNVRGQCETFIALAATAALAAVWRGRAGSRSWFGTGLLLAAAFWLKYNAIVYVVPVLLVAGLEAAVPLRDRVRNLVWLAAGFTGLTAVVLSYFAATGALTDLYLGTIRYNMAYSGETYAGPGHAAAYVLTLPFRHARIDGLWFAGALGSMALAAALIRPDQRDYRKALVPMAWIAAAVISIAINGARSLPQYFVQAGPALALAFGAGLAIAWQTRRRPLGTPLLGALLVVLAAGAWRVGVEPAPGLSPRLFGLPQSAANTAHDIAYLRGLVPRERYLARFERIDDSKYSPLASERLAARTRELTSPDDTALVFGFSSGAVLSRAERRSASRFFWSRPVVLEFAADRPGYGSAGLLQDLERTRPAIVALQKRDWGLAEAATPDSIDFFLANPALSAWLDAAYVPDYEDDLFQVWRRRP